MSKIDVNVIAVYMTDFDSAPKQNLPVSRHVLGEHKVVPIRLFCDGDKIFVDKITDIRKMASLKAGAMGYRYTCLATLDETQREIYVYKDKDSWFMEEPFLLVDDL